MGLHVIMCWGLELNNVDAWLHLDDVYWPSKNSRVWHVLQWHVPFKWHGNAVPHCHQKPGLVVTTDNSTCTVVHEHINVQLHNTVTTTAYVHGRTT